MMDRISPVLIWLYELPDKLIILNYFRDNMYHHKVPYYSM